MNEYRLSGCWCGDIPPPRTWTLAVKIERFAVAPLTHDKYYFVFW